MNKYKTGHNCKWSMKQYDVKLFSRFLEKVFLTWSNKFIFQILLVFIDVGFVAILVLLLVHYEAFNEKLFVF